jgi:hypothetical protein
MPITLRRSIHSVRASSSTAGRVKKYDTSRSQAVDKAEEEGETTHRTDGEIPQHEGADERDEVGDDDGVPGAGEAALRAVAQVFPERTSSFRRSKNTTYESTVTPTDTMMPAMPAERQRQALRLGQQVMMLQRMPPDTERPTATMRPSQR